MDKDVFTQTLHNSLNVISKELRQVNEKKTALQKHPKVSIHKLDFLRHHNKYLKMVHRSKLLYSISGNIDTRLLKAAHLPIPETKNMSSRDKKQSRRLKKDYGSKTYTTDERKAFALLDFVTMDIKRHRYIYGRDDQRKNVYDKNPNDPTTKLMIMLGASKYSYKGGENKVLHQAIVNKDKNNKKIRKLKHRIGIANLAKDHPGLVKKQELKSKNKFNALKQYVKDLRNNKNRADYIKNAHQNHKAKGISTQVKSSLHQNFRDSDYSDVSREVAKNGLKKTEEKYTSSLDDFRAVDRQINIGANEDIVQSGDQPHKYAHETKTGYQQRFDQYRRYGVDQSVKSNKNKLRDVNNGNNFIKHCFDYFKEDPSAYQDVYPKLAKRKQKYAKETMSDPNPREYRTISAVSMAYQKLSGLTPSESISRIKANLTKQKDREVKKFYQKPLERFANARKDESKNHENQKEQQNTQNDNQEKSNHNVNLYNFINQDSDEGPDL